MSNYEKNTDLLTNLFAVLLGLMLGMAVMSPHMTKKPTKPIRELKLNEVEMITIAYETGYQHCVLEIAEIAMDGSPQDVINFLTKNIKEYNEELSTE